MRPIRILNSPTTAIKSSSLSPPSMPQQRSPWHSPVPYLFGGLAAMLGLIAFALLVLACSYWRLSGRLDNEDGGENRDVETGEKQSDSNKQVKTYEEKILVIMAGEEKPTFLATPVSSKACSFGDESCQSQKTEDSKKTENGDQKLKEEDVSDQEQAPTRAENSRAHRIQNQQSQEQN